MKSNTKISIMFPFIFLDQFTKMFSRVFIAFALIVVPTVWCYSSGAPAQACGDMTPQHGVDPQSSNAPYKLYPSTKSIRSGGSVDLELKGDANGNTFKGFFVQARIGDTPVGQFKVDANDKYVQAVNCGGGNKVRTTL